MTVSLSHVNACFRFTHAIVPRCIAAAALQMATSVGDPTTSRGLTIKQLRHHL